MKTLILLANAALFFLACCTPAASQTAATPRSATAPGEHRRSTTTPRKAALQVVVLGSGGPRPFGRAGSGYLVLVDGTPRILLDAGPGAFLRIGELQLDLEQVDIVLLTHLH